MSHSHSTNSGHEQCRRAGNIGPKHSAAKQQRGARVTRGRDRAFAFSMDSAIAVIMVVGAMYVLISAPLEGGKTSDFQTQQYIDDSFAVLHSTGYLLNTVDTNALDDAAQNIYNRTRELLPDTISFRIDLNQYGVDTEDCRNYKTFEECFPTSYNVTATAGPEIPTGRDIFHEKKILMKKQPPGDCNITYLEPPEELTGPMSRKGFALLFSEYTGPLFFQEEGDINITFDVNVVPDTEISCDQNVEINITISVPESIRKPVDLAIVMDKSGSMGGCAIAGGTVIHSSAGSLDGGSSEWSWSCWCWQYTNWQELATFDISGGDAFDVLLEWETACSGSSCTRMYIEAPDLTTYGFYGGTPDDGCYVAPPYGWWGTASNSIYLATPASESQNGTWTVYGWNDDPSIDYDLTVKTITEPIIKMDAAKNAAKNFVDNANWQPQDQMALISYSSSADVEQELTTDRQDIKDEIDNLDDGGSTATGEGIYEATEELTSARANPGALRFQVLLSDGQSNTGRSSSSAATDAASNSIIIYTIGFGTNTNEAELTDIANITGGQYYAATDENALQAIYDLIAMQIEDMASDTNISIPLFPGADIVNYGGAASIDGNIVFDIGAIEPGVPWIGTYILNFPCQNQDNCGIDAVTFPGDGTFFTYTDVNNVVHTIDFNATVTLDFLVRDLRVDIYSGELLGEGETYLDVNVFNIGDLNTLETALNFRLGALNGTLLTSRAVPELCGLGNDECSFYFRIYPSVSIEAEGAIFAIVNDDNAMSECPAGNYDAVNCYGGPSIQYYMLDYYLWRE